MASLKISYLVLVIVAAVLLFVGASQASSPGDFTVQSVNPNADPTVNFTGQQTVLRMFPPAKLGATITLGSAPQGHRVVVVNQPPHLIGSGFDVHYTDFDGNPATVHVDNYEAVELLALTFFGQTRWVVLE